ncbi:helix-turn-helix domain-containing protein [Jannaschia ovalis]|uniref:DNA-binding protein n=1 Tax=Jannaschia ovalis TaxID=3038773 RepID=A0ABY8LB77_9RHOB|nr:helix-turn-helix domain-containing protein [Jannaschia sp. GRR-S6-38]WGH78595.1 DNA-binding protein [Jannaschia sp. GRR-S6-38]
MRHREQDHGGTLSEGLLAKRWQLSCRTLQRWRSQGRGPAFLFIEGSIRYRLSDIIDYEERCVRGGSQ